MMTTILITLALCASLASLAAGYLFGVRRARDARRHLERDLTQRQHDAATLAGARDAQRETLGELRDEAAELRAFGLQITERLERASADHRDAAAELRDRDSAQLTEIEGAVLRQLDQQATLSGQQATLNEQLQQLPAHLNQAHDRLEGRFAALLADATAQAAGSDEVAAQREELQALLHHLQRERRQDAAWKRDVMTLLGALSDAQRVEADLARLETRGSRGDLPQLLDAIRAAGSFAAVLVSDSMGLPLCISGQLDNADVIAGLSSILHSFADRHERMDQTALTAITLHTNSNQSILHRFFSLGAERYLLTVVATGRALPHHTLDPVLGELERLLDTETWNPERSQPSYPRVPVLSVSRH